VAGDAESHMEKTDVAVRRLIRGARSAALATASAGEKDWPYASLVTVACDMDATPLLLLSELSDHTRNIAVDGRASLLFEAASGLDSPQTGPRVTVMGRLAKSEDERHARRFLARHPAARAYAGFGDFHFHAMAVEKAHYVGGFARAQWLDGAEVLFAAAASAALAGSEDEVTAQMNRDHADAVRLYANALLGRRGKAWKMIGVDPEGADLRLRGSLARLDFAEPVKDAEECRRELARLAAGGRMKG